RELHVHQDQVRMMFDGHRDAALAVGGFEQAVGRALEEIAHELAIHLVVLDVEDRPVAHVVASVATRTGMEKMKVEPLPSSLSTPIQPPCISTNFFVMLSPSPVPP